MHSREYSHLYIPTARLSRHHILLSWGPSFLRRGGNNHTTKQNTHPGKPACWHCMEAGEAEAPVLWLWGVPLVQKAATRLQWARCHCLILTAEQIQYYWSFKKCQLMQAEVRSFATQQTTVYIKDVTTASSFSSGTFHFPSRNKGILQTDCKI